MLQTFVELYWFTCGECGREGTGERDFVLKSSSGCSVFVPKGFSCILAKGRGKQKEVQKGLHRGKTNKKAKMACVAVTSEGRTARRRAVSMRQ